MESIPQLPPETEAALHQQEGSVLSLNGAQGRYVLMSADLFETMLGISEQRSETLASIKRGLADTAAGRTRPAEEVFDRLDKKYAS